MSDGLGPLAFGRKQEPIFLGREFSRHGDYSELTSKMIDKEVSNIIITAYKRASLLINNNLEALDRIANALLEKETLTRGEIDELMSGSIKEIQEEIH